MRIKHLKTNGCSSYISKNMQNKIKTDIYTHTHTHTHIALLYLCYLMSNIHPGFELTSHDSDSHSASLMLAIIYPQIIKI